MTNCSRFFKLLMVTLVAAVVTPCVNADDVADRNERQFAELREQIQQMRAEMEELRAILREMRTDREAAKPDLPPELQEQLHAMKNRIQELMQAGRVDEANAVEREAAALMEHFAAVQQGEREAVKPDLPPELQQRLHAMKNRIQELMQAGRVDEANAVEREANALLERFVATQYEEPSKDATEVALPPEVAERLADMKREIQELREARQLDAAEALEREAREILQQVADAAAEQGDAVPQPPKDGAGPAARLDHLRAAAEHLQAAGSLDLAERVRQQIEEMERDRGE